MIDEEEDNEHTMKILRTAEEFLESKKFSTELLETTIRSNEEFLGNFSEDEKKMYERLLCLRKQNTVRSAVSDDEFEISRMKTKQDLDSETKSFILKHQESLTCSPKSKPELKSQSSKLSSILKNADEDFKSPTEGLKSFVRDNTKLEAITEKDFDERTDFITKWERYVNLVNSALKNKNQDEAIALTFKKCNDNDTSTQKMILQAIEILHSVSTTDPVMMTKSVSDTISVLEEIGKLSNKSTKQLKSHVLSSNFGYEYDIIPRFQLSIKRTVKMLFESKEDLENEIDILKDQVMSKNKEIEALKEMLQDKNSLNRMQQVCHQLLNMTISKQSNMKLDTKAMQWIRNLYGEKLYQKLRENDFIKPTRSPKSKTRKKNKKIKAETKLLMKEMQEMLSNLIEFESSKSNNDTGSTKMQNDNITRLEYIKNRVDELQHNSQNSTSKSVCSDTMSSCSAANQSFSKISVDGAIDFDMKPTRLNMDEAFDEKAYASMERGKSLDNDPSPIANFIFPIQQPKQT